MECVRVGDEGCAEPLAAQVSGLDHHQLEELGQPHPEELDVEEQVVLAVDVVLQDVEHLDDRLAGGHHNVVHPHCFDDVKCLFGEYQTNYHRSSFNTLLMLNCNFKRHLC